MISLLAASLEELQNESGFSRINKGIQGMLFTAHGTETDPVKRDPILKLLEQAGEQITVSDIFNEQDKAIITLTIPGKNGCGNIFFIDLTATQTLLNNSTSEGNYLELRDAANTILFSKKIEGDLIKVRE